MRLTEETGQYIENFGNKMAKMARHISGTGFAPIDLSTVVVTAFIDYEVLSFHLKDTGLNELVESNSKDLYTDDIIRKLNTKLRHLKAQGLWGPSEGNKLDT